MNARQDSAWKNLSFYRGYLPPADRERVKEYVLLALGEDNGKRENSMDPGMSRQASVAPGAQSTTPLSDIVSPCDVQVSQLGAGFKADASNDTYVPPLTIGLLSPLTLSTSLLQATAAPSMNVNGVIGPSSTTVATSGGAAAIAAGGSSTTAVKKPECKRFFIIKKSALVQVPHFKSFLFKVKKCLDICLNPLPCTPDCPNVHVEVNNNPELIELNTDGVESMIVNRGNQLPSISVKLIDMDKTAGALFCCALMKQHITQAVQGTQCRFGDRCRYGNRCLFIHLKPSAQGASEEELSDALIDITESETKIGEAVPFLKTQPAFLERLKEIGMETVGDVQVLSNTAFDSLVARSPADEQWLWTQVHNIRELKERDIPLSFALATFPGLSFDKVSGAVESYRLEAISQLLALKPKAFYAMKMPPKVLDACERIRQRYEPEREAYSTIDLTKLSDTAFFRKMATIALQFRLSNAHKSWRKQDATRPIVTSLITFVDSYECGCQAHGGTFSATQTPCIGPLSKTGSTSNPLLSSPSRAGSTSQQEQAFPENSWCRCPRRWELAVNYELSTPSGSRCSEQNCLGKLASMGLPTCAIREIFVHGDMHNNEDPNPLFPCGVCENMLRRITHDVHKQHGGDVTLYMFDQVIHPRKLVSIPVQEISHREGSNFKRFIQEDLRGDEDKLEFNSSIS